jgi:periplasmic protein TonB
MNLARRLAVHDSVPAARVSRFSSERSSARQAARERIHARVVHPIDAPRLLGDPLERKESRALSAIAGARLLVAAVVLHGLVMVGFALVSRAVGEPRAFHPPERLQISIVETPQAALPAEPELSKEEAPPVPEFAPLQEPKRAEPPPKKAPPPPAPAPAAAPAEEAVAPEPAPRRIVGLSLESTVEGAGPAFATGTSRLGATDEQAVDPVQAAQRTGTAAAAAPRATATSAGAQRAATHIPTRDAQWVAPVRSSPSQPEFPATLKAQNLEGDVVVSVDISARGDVTRIAIVRGSGYPEFDEAARQAAKKERFSPALRDGQAVPFTLTYTYRFRIED